MYMIRTYTAPTEFSAVAAGLKRPEVVELRVVVAVTRHLPSMTLDFDLPGQCRSNEGERAKAAMRSEDVPTQGTPKSQPKQKRWVVKLIIKTYVNRHEFFILLLCMLSSLYLKNPET